MKSSSIAIGSDTWLGISRRLRLRATVRQELLGAVLALAALLVSHSALADYKVGPGDILEISVLGVPQLQKRVSVEADGSISFPIIGNLPLRGLSLAEVRAQIRTALGGRLVSLRSTGGESISVVVDMNDILVSVAEYRPIFIRGEVAKPGEYPFRGPLAIREALALAGGFLVGTAVGEQSLLRSLDLRAELEASWLELVKERARLWRVSSELAGTDEGKEAIAQAVPRDAPVSREAITRIVELAADHLEARRADHKRQEEALEAIVSQLDKEITIMEEQLAVDEKAYKEEAREFAEFTELKDRGVVNAQRYAEARRDLVASSTRLLLGSTRLSDARRDRIERQLQLHKLRADRKAILYQELEALTSRLNELQAKIRGASDQLGILGVRAGWLGRIGPIKPKFLVFRRTADGVEHLVADESFELEPGDVVEVTITGNGSEHASR